MKSRDGSLRRKKIQVREKVYRKVAKHRVFPMICGGQGRKVGSLKRRVRSQLARWEMKNCTPLWREARFQVKMCKTSQPRSTFGSWDVKKVHAVAARSTFRSQKCKKLTGSEHLGSWGVEKCTPLWREAHFEIKSVKNWRVRSTFGTWDVEKVHAIVVRRCEKHISKQKC